MTFNENANVGGSKARRRGAGIAVAGGGVAGLGVVVVLLLNLLTGGDLSGLLGDGTQVQTGGGSDEGAVEGCRTGADANRDDTCRLAATSTMLDEYWGTYIKGYQDAGLVIVDGSTPTPCGTASNATGPFYCPGDATVYIDPAFFSVLHQQFGATSGNLAQMYVLAHEYGHHVQDITGIMQKYPNNGTGPASNGVRTELQADCFAGAWVQDAAGQKDAAGVAYIKEPTQAQIDDALNAAASVGDDHIQKEATGRVNPESWTHGSSAQRVRWFTAGYRDGVNACDTFSVAGGDL
ncbi:KPN_02809 family neutral zinc metallopeptidase [Microbacterium terrisoli]|jgi:predicted metalloprotease|uniref:KPN_02809 family neutral zinc metallopeptidase n=1 Tax=Microbacterium terrisoli TaxID=3242192 RepID=UPI00280646C6|nr:neutral zinc metallopeptidase [Microbacterium protaetiae]